MEIKPNNLRGLNSFPPPNPENIEIIPDYTPVDMPTFEELLGLSQEQDDTTNHEIERSIGALVGAKSFAQMRSSQLEQQLSVGPSDLSLGYGKGKRSLSVGGRRGRVRYIAMAGVIGAGAFLYAHMNEEKGTSSVTTESTVSGRIVTESEPGIPQSVLNRAGSSFAIDTSTNTTVASSPETTLPPETTVPPAPETTVTTTPETTPPETTLAPEVNRQLAETGFSYSSEDRTLVFQNMENCTDQTVTVPRGGSLIGTLIGIGLDKELVNYFVTEWLARPNDGKKLEADLKSSDQTYSVKCSTVYAG